MMHEHVTDEVVAPDPESTEAHAARWVRQLPRGAVVAVEGPLGAGKTTWVRGAVAALSGDPLDVASPTYTVINEYPTREGMVAHVDLYRLDSTLEVLSLDLERLQAEARLVLVEWFDRGASVLPAAWFVTLIPEADAAADGDEVVSPRRIRVRKGDATPAPPAR